MLIKTYLGFIYCTRVKTARYVLDNMVLCSIPLVIHTFLSHTHTQSTVIKCLIVASPGFIKVGQGLHTGRDAVIVLLLLLCRINLLNIYLPRLSRLTIKFCWKINLNFYW